MASQLIQLALPTSSGKTPPTRASVSQSLNEGQQQCCLAVTEHGPSPSQHSMNGAQYMQKKNASMQVPASSCQ